MEYSRNEQFMNSNAPWRQPKQVVEGLFVPEKKKNLHSQRINQ